MRFRLKCDNKNYNLQKKILSGETIEITEEDSEYTIYLEKNIGSIKCKKQDKIYKINIGEILYFQTTGRYNYLFTINDTYQVDVSLLNMTSLLPTHFIRISKSGIVNIKSIEYIKPLYNSRYELKIGNYDSIIVTRSFYKIFKKKLGLWGVIYDYDIWYFINYCFIIIFRIRSI